MNALRKALRYLEDHVLAWLQRRCEHPGQMVAADVLEGCVDGVEVKFCRRCGAVKTIYPLAGSVSDWRRPNPNLWRDRAALRQRMTAETEVERLRMQLDACSTAAMSNTAAEVARRLDRSGPYSSTAYRDVCRAVDREMALRDQRDREVREFIGWLSGDIPELHKVSVPALADSWDRFKVEKVIRAPAVLSG